MGRWRKDKPAGTAIGCGVGPPRSCDIAQTCRTCWIVARCETKTDAASACRSATFLPAAAGRYASSPAWKTCAIHSLQIGKVFLNLWRSGVPEVENRYLATAVLRQASHIRRCSGRHGHVSHPSLRICAPITGIPELGRPKAGPCSAATGPPVGRPQWRDAGHAASR